MSEETKPIILISTGNTVNPEIRGKLLVQFIHQRGGIPIFADHSKLEEIPDLVEAVDGIIVQGNSYAPESLRLTDQSKGFSSTLESGDKVIFETTPDQTTMITYQKGEPFPYAGILQPVPASALQTQAATSSERWYLVDQNLVDMREIGEIGRILRFNPNNLSFHDAVTGKPFELPVGWSFESSNADEQPVTIHSPDGTSISLEGMLVDPVKLTAHALTQTESVAPLTEEPTEYYHPALSFKPDNHERGAYELALFNVAQAQGTKEIPAKVRDTSDQPVLAICGGFQELAGLHGAKFYPYIEEDVEQHLPEEQQVRHYSPDMKDYKAIPYEMRKAIEAKMHIGRVPVFEPSAEVRVLDGTLKDIIGTGKFNPMSTHVTGVAADSLPAELELTAVSPNDNVAEGFRYIDQRNPDRFFHAVQFHPDGFQTPEDYKLIETFMERAKERAVNKPKRTPEIPQKLLKNSVIEDAIKQIETLSSDGKTMPEEASSWRHMVLQDIEENRGLASLAAGSVLQR